MGTSIPYGTLSAMWTPSKTTPHVIVIIVYLAFFLDNMLLTVVVPIIPDILHTTSLKLIPKSIFYDKIENFLPTSTDQTTQLRLKNISYDNEDKFELTLLNDDILNKKYISQRESEDNEEIERENGPVGVLLSSKAIVQLVLNPLVGLWTAKVGYNVPIFFGSINLLTASLLFAYGESYFAMLAARSIQGVCSACIGVSGMCLAAETFKDEDVRSKIMGILLGGGALGVLVGYPFGGLLYEFVGKTAPFLIISTITIIMLVLQVMFLDFTSPLEITERKSTIWWPLLTDNVLILTTGAIFISTSAMAILEPCLPIWLMTHLKPEKWQLGTVFIPDSMGYLLGTNFFGIIACRLGHWRVSVCALIVVGASAFMIPNATSLSQLLLPHFGLGLGIGVLDAALVPQLASLVDRRHIAQYGAVFSLQQTAVSLAYCIAPLLGGKLARSIGFSWTLRGLGLINAFYSTLLAGLAWKLNSDVQITRLTDSQSSDCESLNQAIHLVAYGSTFE